MKSTLLILSLVLPTATPDRTAPRKVYQPLDVRSVFSSPNTPVFRGQSPSYDEQLQTLPPVTAPSGGYNPFTPQPNQDPFLTQPFGVDSLIPSYGIQRERQRTERLGWTPTLDYAIIPGQGAKLPNAGKLEDQEFDLNLVYRESWGPEMIFTSTPQFGARLWEGPRTTPTSNVSLPGAAYRFGWDLGLETVPTAGWSWHAHFNPSVNSDFENSVSRNAWNFDAWGYGLFEIDPAVRLMVGAGYWDRVDGIVVPYVGLIWNPDPYWEIKAAFPESRVSFYVGQFWDASHWLYANLAYHVESFEVNRVQNAGPALRDQVQLEDYRLTFGLRSDHRTYEKYFEVGYIFNRNIEYARIGPKFDVNEGFIARLGIKF